MISFELEEANNINVPWDNKDFEYWVENFVEEGYDEDIAESAVNKALESHLKDGIIDNYTLCLDDAYWWVEVFQDEKDGTTPRTRGLEK